MRTPRSRRRLRDRLTAIIATVGVASLAAGFLVIGTAGSAQAQQDNVWVCKYTGRPVVGEVAHHVIPQSAVGLGEWFVDGQSWSYAVMDVTDPSSKIEEAQAFALCPPYNPTEDIEVSPVMPYATPESCGVDGALVIPDQPTGAEVIQTPEGTGPGTYTITFSAGDGYVFPDEAEVTYTITVNPAIPYQSSDPAAPCYLPPGPQTVTPSAPSVTAADCGAAGSLVIPSQPTGVVVSQQPAGTGPGTYVVTFSPASGYVFPAGTTTSHELVVPDAIPYQSTNPTGVCYQAPPPPTDVCTNIDGVQTEVPAGYEAEDGVCALVEPEPEDVCANIEGAQTEVPEGYVEDDGVCAEIQGEEAEQPEPATPVKPVKPAKPVEPAAPAVQPDEVLGTEAALPTSVDAGLGSPTASAGSASPLGQGLMAAGLVLMALAGAMKVGRRERGVHEA